MLWGGLRGQHAARIRQSYLGKAPQTGKGSAARQARGTDRFPCIRHGASSRKGSSRSSVGRGCEHGEAMAELAARLSPPSQWDGRVSVGRTPRGGARLRTDQCWADFLTLGRTSVKGCVVCRLTSSGRAAQPAHPGLVSWWMAATAAAAPPSVRDKSACRCKKWSEVACICVLLCGICDDAICV